MDKLPSHALDLGAKTQATNSRDDFNTGWDYVQYRLYQNDDLPGREA